MDRFTISLRTALLVLIVASVVPCGLLLHLTWWRTATGATHELVDTLERQITDAVQRAWWGRVYEVQGLARTVHEALAAGDDPVTRERVLATAAVSTSALSWLVHLSADPAAGIIAVEDGPAGATRLFRADAAGRVEQVVGVTKDPLTLQALAEPSPPSLAIVGEGWLAAARGRQEPGWAEVARVPGGDGSDPRAVAYVDGGDGNLLAAMIGYGRFAALLGEIPVGRTGRSYVLGPDGAIVIASDAPMAPRLALMDDVASAAGRLVAARVRDRLNVEENARLEVAGAGYAVGLSPLWFKGWQLAVIVPESEFLAAIDRTIARVALGLAAFVLVASVAGVLAARRLVGLPIARVMGDIAHVERFELDHVPRRRSRLTEIDRLSDAIVRMSEGLADFAKFIPTDLVRDLLASGMRAEPGGSRRELTVLFADLAGFARLAEQLGDEVVPVVSRFLDATSRAVAAHGGTVDKFIGDAVMAFWGAPRPDPDHALHACRAALALAAVVDRLELPEVAARGLQVRIGIQTGPAIVGNVGSASRLNYTALGDTVNLASRLEGVNKVYGTTILIGAATREAAGARIIVREVDTVAVYGRAEGVIVVELLGLADDSPRPVWIDAYEGALAAYRQRRFAEALVALERLLADRADPAAAHLAETCRTLLNEPPDSAWRPITSLEVK